MQRKINYFAGAEKSEHRDPTEKVCDSSLLRKLEKKYAKLISPFIISVVSGKRVETTKIERVQRRAAS